VSIINWFFKYFVISLQNLSDKRLQLTNEVLQGIRLVKLCGWENEFVDRITDARNNELDLLDKDSIYWGSMST